MRTVLIANRGEIALRIMKTCRRLGLATVAVHSDADARAPFVHFADQAVRLGPAAPAQSYLSVEALLRAAALSGADAVHPGYGFLSENPDFAQACLDRGLVFIGPPPAAIRAMGLKREAKALVARRGVPLVPGFDGGDQSLAALREAAALIGLPVILKPSAGGGGKGMHIVRAEAELEPAVERARREAERAFGDRTLIVEKYLERPRHVEVQILADSHGTLLHLGERECSLQRRHQKIIEEAPCLALSPAQREAICQSAIEVARAVGYVGAGTVELLVDGASGSFYFSEMNTRLQVEHRVTELVYGVDLVEQQLRVARGEKLAFTQEGLRPRGHAIEARLYAEDPGAGFLPTAGPVLDFWVPPLGGLLVDSGVESGGEVSTHYDPLVAKLVAHGETRADAAGTLALALEELSCLGLPTNQDFLLRLVRHPDFVAGALHTQLIEQAFEARPGPLADPRRDEVARVAAVLAASLRRRATLHLPDVPSGYRNNPFAGQQVEVDGKTLEYRWVSADEALVKLDGGERRWRVRRFEAPLLELEDEAGLRHRVRLVTDGLSTFVHTRLGTVVVREAPRFPAAQDETLRGGLMAAMPGRVVRVLVKAGQAVTRGQALVVLEAMKMEQTTHSPVDGTVREVTVREGQQVAGGEVLVVLDEG